MFTQTDKDQQRFQIAGGFFTVAMSLLGTTGAISAVTRTGLASLIGWILLVITNVFIFYFGRSLQNNNAMFSSKVTLGITASWLLFVIFVMMERMGVW